MATGYDFYVYIIYGHRAISCIGHRRNAKDKAVQRLYGDRTEILMIVRISYDLTISVRCFFAPLLKKKLYARCMISARPLHDDPALVRCHLRCV